MSSQPEPNSLWAAVRAAPDDTTRKLVLADYLDENDQALTAYAVRWCVARDQWPRLTKTMACWCTDPSTRVPGTARDARRARLPLVFFVAGEGYERRHQITHMHCEVSFDTLAKAIDYLGHILETLKGWTACEAN